MGSGSGARRRRQITVTQLLAETFNAATRGRGRHTRLARGEKRRFGGGGQADGGAAASYVDRGDGGVGARDLTAALSQQRKARRQGGPAALARRCQRPAACGGSGEAAVVVVSCSRTVRRGGRRGRLPRSGLGEGARWECGGLVLRCGGARGRSRSWEGGRGCIGHADRGRRSRRRIVADLTKGASEWVRLARMMAHDGHRGLCTLGHGHHSTVDFSAARAGSALHTPQPKTARRGLKTTWAMTKAACTSMRQPAPAIPRPVYRTMCTWLLGDHEEPLQRNSIEPATLPCPRHLRDAARG